MVKRICMVALCLVAFCGVVLAQAEGEMPKPGPEHQKLAYFEGKWKSEGVTHENPFMPAGKFSSDDSCHWFEGGFAMVCMYDGEGPTGPSKGLGIMGYNTMTQMYTYYGVDNGPMAMTSVPLGTVEGDTWTYHDEMEIEGKTIKSRYVMKILSPTSYTYKWEVLGDDGSWMTVMEGKATKAS